MLMLSPAAAAEIHAATPRSGAEGLALRVAARVEADGSMALGLGFDEQREGDLPLDLHGVQVLIAPPSQALLDEALLDFVELAPGRHGFVCLPQPVPASTPGCGSGGCGTGVCGSQRGSTPGRAGC